MHSSFNQLVLSRSTTIPIIETKIFIRQNKFSYPILFLLSKRKGYDTAKAYTHEFIKKTNRSNKGWANLTNTIWITDNFEDYKNTPNATESYSVISHELGHMLGELKHTYDETPNLMNSSDHNNSKNFMLNSEQCKMIQENLNKDLL